VRKFTTPLKRRVPKAVRLRYYEYSRLMKEEPLPRRFGPYLLYDKIGAGGMAQLYLGNTKTGLGVGIVDVVMLGQRR
jgi:hypothetical protein